LLELGYEAPAAVLAGETSIRDPGALDLSEREEESLYVEARKPRRPGAPGSVGIGVAARVWRVSSPSGAGPGREVYAELYRADLAAEAAWLRRGARHKVSSIQRLLGARVPGKLLEFGCGTGVILEDLVLQRPVLRKPRVPNKAGHIQFVTQRSFRRLLDAAGLRMVDGFAVACVKT